MAAILGGAAITAGGALVSAGIQAWFNNQAQEDALKEARRTEKLNIKFAEEQTKRDERRFARGFKLQEENLDLKKSQANINTTQSILSNMQGLMQSNRATSMQIGNYNRGRQ